MALQRERFWTIVLSLTILLVGGAHASIGDRLPDFRRCLDVCRTENCGPNGPHTPIPVLHRVLLWDCASECDYTCQHIVTGHRVAAAQPIVQFHGKWPFYRFLGMQEPFSVLFSLGNLWAHWAGLRKLRSQVPAAYSLRPFYVVFSYVGMSSWVFSSIFHTRDFRLTEELDYLAAGASIFYGMYYTPIRIFRLDIPTSRRSSVLRAWTLVCALLYAAHVAYLKLVRWDYGYNMAANVAAGILQNILWSWFSVQRYRRSGRTWAMWPGIAVAWIMFGMSLELFDFPPWLGSIDAHSLWHLMTIGPTVLWYNFLVKDAHDDMAGTERLKA